MGVFGMLGILLMDYLPIGSTLQHGKYKIINVLGSGGFGITYEGVQSGLNRTVAIKELFLSGINTRSEDGLVEKNNDSTSYVVRDEFCKECKLLNGLNHEHIIHVLDYFEENNTIYRITNYISGITLQKYVSQEGKIAESKALSIMKEICSLINYLHEHNILHLDVKPSNFMYGNDGHISLIDLGIAINTATFEDSSVFYPGYTRGYAPLEQTSGLNKKNLSVTIDVYALGATTFKLLTGRDLPLAADIANDGFPEQDLISAGVSSKTIACIKKAMEPLQKNRYQSVVEFADALGINIITPTIMNNAQQMRDERFESSETNFISQEVDDVTDVEIVATVGQKNEIIGALPIGTKLQSKNYTYEIKDVLGQGSFGITYLAELIINGTLGSLGGLKVAVKEFFMKDINGRNETAVTAGSKGGIYEKYKDKFKKESQHLSELKHPNIVKVFEAFEENNTCYYSMEYVEGTNLNAYIKQLGRIPLAEAVSIVNDVGNALSFMHAHKMLHLDLKPLNIMRRTNGEIILIDFGLSKQYDQSGMPETSTTVGAGTPGYAPLEQANYHDGRGFPVTMDVYALTASFYKMLTGLTPQDATEVLNEGLDVDSLRRANVGEQVISVIERGMNPIVKNRSQSIDELLKMVHSLASSDGNIMNNSEETVFDY